MQLSAFTLRQRILIFVIFCWFSLATAIASNGYSGFDWSVLFGLGLFPVLFLAGLFWIVQGLIASNPARSERMRQLTMQSFRSLRDYFSNWRPKLAKVAYLAGFLIVSGTTKVLIKSWLNPSASQIAATMATELTPKLPMRVDEATTLFRVRSEGETFHYIYHLQIGEISESRISEVRAALPNLRDKIVEQACTNDGLGKILKYGIKISYDYFTTGDDILGSIEVNRSDCRSNAATAKLPTLNERTPASDQAGN